MRDISETKFETYTIRPDVVTLATMLQATRGFLLIVFNWTLFIEFEKSRSIPGVDVMAVLPPSIFFLIGFMDILMAKRLWSKGSNGWEYGIAMSAVICPIFCTMGAAILLTSFSLTHYSTILIIVIALFAIVEIIALVTPDARNY